MSLEFLPPKRESAPVLVGISGPSGGGKTFSALRFARGLANGQPFAILDTENGRALHYADFFPEMRHANLRDFSPAAYAAAIADADAQGFPVIVVDSISHEWEGDGGVLRMQEAEFARMGSKESARLASWAKPKQEHKALVRDLLRTSAHVVLCMRAEDKVEMVKVDGKTEVRAKETMTSILGWIPICERRLPFELTLSMLVTPDFPGVPKFIKIQEQFRPFFPEGEPIGEDAGRALAAWAAGGTLAGEPKAPGRPASDRVSRASDSDSEPASPAELATDEERREIARLAGERGMTREEAQELLVEVAGVKKTAELPRDKLAAVTKAIAAWHRQEVLV